MQQQKPSAVGERTTGQTEDCMDTKKIVIDGTEMAAHSHRWKTGTCGYMCLGKIYMDGRKYQVSVSLYEIGSKDQSHAKKGGGK